MTVARTSHDGLPDFFQDSCTTTVRQASRLSLGLLRYGPVIVNLTFSGIVIWQQCDSILDLLETISQTYYVFVHAWREGDWIKVYVEV